MYKNLIKHTAFTMAGGGQATPIFGLTTRRIAFTMAEILLSLTIIGVVAAITLPSLTANINERTWNTQRKALHARLSQAVSMMPQIKGYGTFSQTPKDSNGEYPKKILDISATERFVTEGLSKVLKINNICGLGSDSDCGFPKEIIKLGTAAEPKLNILALGTLEDLHIAFTSLSDTFGGYYYYVARTIIETANGESILIHYNPGCNIDFNPTRPYINGMTMMCANFIYDLNGKKGPNTVGKDVGFMTLLYPTDPVLVAPMPLNKQEFSLTTKYSEANAYCKAHDARLPNIEELLSMAYNYKLLGNDFLRSAYRVWSSTGGDKFSTSRILKENFYNPTTIHWAVIFPDSSAIVEPIDKEQDTALFRCIKRN